MFLDLNIGVVYVFLLTKLNFGKGTTDDYTIAFGIHATRALGRGNDCNRKINYLVGRLFRKTASFVN